MALRDVFASVVPVIDNVFSSMQSGVRHDPYKSQTDEGDIATRSAATRKAHVFLTNTIVKGLQGQEILAKVHLVFPRQIAIHVLDTFTLADGTTGPIVSVKSPIDPKTGKGFVTEVWLG